MAGEKPPVKGEAGYHEKIDRTVTPLGGTNPDGSQTVADKVVCPLFPEVNTPKNANKAAEMKLYMGVDPSGDYICQIPTSHNEQDIMDEFGPGNYYVVPVNFAGDPVVNGRKLRLRGRANLSDPASLITGNKQSDTLTVIQMQLSEARRERDRMDERARKSEEMHNALMLRMLDGNKGGGEMTGVLVAMIQANAQTTAAMMTAISGNKGTPPEIQASMQNNSAIMNTLLASVLNPNKPSTTADRLVEAMATKAMNSDGNNLQSVLQNVQAVQALTAGNNNVAAITAIGGVAKELGLAGLIASKVMGNGTAKVLPPETRTTITVEPNGNGHAPATATAPSPLPVVSNPLGGENVTQEQAVAEIDSLVLDDSKKPEDVAACLIKHCQETKAVPGWVLGPLLQSKDDDATLTGWWNRLGVPHWASTKYAPKVKAALGCINMEK